MTLARRPTAALVALLLTAGLSACSEKEPGNATAGPGAGSGRPSIPTTAPPDSGGPTSTKPDPAKSPLANTDPCTLIPTSATTSLGVTSPGKPEKLGLARTCQWQDSGGDYALTAGIFDSAGLDNVQNRTDAKNVEPVQTVSGKHEALKWESAGSCIYSFAMTATSRVDIIVTTALPEKRCPAAKTLADAVEPTLPPQIK